MVKEENIKAIVAIDPVTGKYLTKGSPDAFGNVRTKLYEFNCLNVFLFYDMEEARDVCERYNQYHKVKVKFKMKRINIHITSEIKE